MFIYLFYYYSFTLVCSPPVQVDIRFPQPGSDEPDKVTVTGLPDTVDNAIDHLLNLEEEFVSSQTRWMQSSLFSSQSERN